MYKNNSVLIAKTKVSNYKKDLYLTEILVCFITVLFIYQRLAHPYKKTSFY
jgi:hypothetical protein